MNTNYSNHSEPSVFPLNLTFNETEIKYIQEHGMIYRNPPFVIFTQIDLARLEEEMGPKTMSVFPLALDVQDMLNTIQAKSVKILKQTQESQASEGLNKKKESVTAQSIKVESFIKKEFPGSKQGIV
jgi:hypothetical protein